ncbi:glycosyltransferase family 4 protein [Spirosoma jeollabukense]
MEKSLVLISEHASPLASIGGVDAGGQNIAVAELACGLAQVGYTVDVFTRCTSPQEAEIVHWKPRIRVIHIAAGPREYLSKEKLLPHMDEFAQNMSRFIRENAMVYRLVHAHFFMSGLVALTLRQQLKLPFVITFHALGLVRRIHQGADDGFPAERIAIEKRIVQEADGIIALCPQDSVDLITLYGASPSKTSIIPNGYNPDDFFPVGQAIARQQLGLAPQIPLLLQLGRLVPRKGIATVIQALALLHQKHTIPAQLLIVGGDSRHADPTLTPEIGRLQHIASELGVEDHVTFTGSRERHELRNYYSAADAFVTTPSYEPFGITPLEAMACGTPVVGSAVGGIKHTILANKTGFLVPPNDPVALAARLAVLLSHKSLRDQYSRAAIQHVRSGYTWQQVARQTADLYDLITNGRIQTGIWLGAAQYQSPTLYKSKNPYE